MAQKNMLALFAKPRCKICLGRGVVRMMPAGADTLTAQICSCAKDRYDKHMTERKKTPCPVCGEKGYCNHRPATLRSALEAIYE